MDREDRRLPSHKNASSSGDSSLDRPPNPDDGKMLVLPGDYLGLESFAVEPAPIADPDVWPPPTPTPESDNLNRAPRAAVEATPTLSPPNPARRGDPVTRIRGCAVAAPVDALCPEKAARQRLPVWARSPAIPTPDSGGSENGGGNNAGPGTRVGAARRRDGAIVQRKMMVFGEGGGGGGGGGGGVLGGAQMGPWRGGRGERSRSGVQRSGGSLEVVQCFMI